MHKQASSLHDMALQLYVRVGSCLSEHCQMDAKPSTHTGLRGP